MNMDEIYTKRVISHNEAREIANRLVASHFRKSDTEHARISIPANPERDDDLLLGAYIRQQERARPEEAIREAATKTKQPTTRGWYYALPPLFVEEGDTDPWPHYVAESGDGVLWSEKMPLSYFCWYGPVPSVKSAHSPAPRVEEKEMREMLRAELRKSGFGPGWCEYIVSEEWVGRPDNKDDESDRRFADASLAFGRALMERK